MAQSERPLTFYENPILNSPDAYPGRHWELDADGQPTNVLIESRRRSDLITPVPKAKKRKAAKGPTAQVELDLSADDEGLSTAEQKYDPTPSRRCQRATFPRRRSGGACDVPDGRRGGKVVGQRAADACPASPLSGNR